MHPDEAAFQAALDADPSDQNARYAFAGWLEEQGDARARGYWALAANGCWPNWVGDDVSRPRFYWFNDWGFYRRIHNGLPLDWWHEIDVLGKDIAGGLCPSAEKADKSPRDKLEDAAALAFLRLPPSRQSELLALAQEAAA